MVFSVELSSYVIRVGLVGGRPVGGSTASGDDGKDDGELDKKKYHPVKT